LKKLVRRKLMYHSYSMQVYGYISSPTSGRGSFTLVHGVCSVSEYGFYIAYALNVSLCEAI